MGSVPLVEGVSADGGGRIVIAIIVLACGCLGEQVVEVLDRVRWPTIRERG